MMFLRKTLPAYGERRFKSGFLFTAATILDHLDNGRTDVGTRWLESAAWEEEWTKGREGDFWKKLRWTD